MERVMENLNKAKRYVKVADHMLTMTFPLVKDPRMLLAVLENIFLAYTHGMGAVLYKERMFKRIPPFHETFESKFNMFRDKLVPRFNIDKAHLRSMQEIKEIVYEHKTSPVEFSRKDRFVICSNDYRMKAITVLDLKKYLANAKVFIESMARILSR